MLATLPFALTGVLALSCVVRTSEHPSGPCTPPRGLVLAATNTGNGNGNHNVGNGNGNGNTGNNNGNGNVGNNNGNGNAGNGQGNGNVGSGFGNGTGQVGTMSRLQGYSLPDLNNGLKRLHHWGR